MDRTLQGLARLKTITALLADKALAPVAKVNQRVRTIENRVERLAQHRQALMSASDDPSLSGTLMVQAERLRMQQAATLQELAKARVAYEQEKTKAARAVGKDLVLAEMIKKKATAAKLEESRRRLR